MLADDGGYEIDLAEPARRGLAMGLNEAAGYVAAALAELPAGDPTALEAGANRCAVAWHA